MFKKTSIQFLAMVFILQGLPYLYAETSPAKGTRDISQEEVNELLKDDGEQEPSGPMDSGVTMRVSELNSRVGQLEREIRFQNEKIRTLERAVEDLRRYR